MKSNWLIHLTIICGIIVILGVITYQWFLACCIIAVFVLVLFVWHVIETLSAIRQSIEKIERHLDEMQKTKP
jgi:ABC-type polysaccharide/polyol phosphate export permease